MATVRATPSRAIEKGSAMKTAAQGYSPLMSLLSAALLIATGTALIPCEVSYAQVPQVDAGLERCKQLLNRFEQRKQLTDEELITLKTCLEPLKRREKEKTQAAPEIPPIQQQAPLRIYGK
ncbi:MAG: hypothetical protein HYY85_02615 [Deltaproteobacteria bacterium]|nr:hypothetical protein [Deltaproteobacteria bacterium]